MTMTVKTHVDPVVEELATTNDIDNDFSGWYCIKVDPAKVCQGCGTSLQYVSELEKHKIVVWPEMDDPNMLDIAVIVKSRGRNPKVVEYEQSMGKCISYYKWISSRYKRCG